MMSASKRLEDAFPDTDAATLLLAAREKEGWTQKQLADKTGLSINKISSFENGKTIPNTAQAKTLAAVLNFDYRLFLDPNQVKSKPI